jgi:hypothetical protein
MSELRMTLSLGAAVTRVIAVDTRRENSETLLKARLAPAPAHPRALQWLLEAVALWQGTAVRAAVHAAPCAASSATNLYHDWFADFGNALYTLQLCEGQPARRRAHKDAIGFGGEFHDLRQLTLQMAGVR